MLRAYDIVAAITGAVTRQRVELSARTVACAGPKELPCDSDHFPTLRTSSSIRVGGTHAK